MKLAVFTSKYPARVATFFERDMRALVEAGVELDVFVIAPLNPAMWEHSLDLLSPTHLPRNRIHHLSAAEAARAARPVVRANFAACRRDSWSILSAAARHGAVPFGKTAYVLPKAWAWAGQYQGQFDHVLAYWGNYAGTCAYAFHRLAGTRGPGHQHVPFSIWLHAGVDLYRTPVFLKEKLLYADNIITCCEFNQGYITRLFPQAAADVGPKVHVCHHGLDLVRFPYQPEGRPANRILAVGRLAKHKGFDYLVRAVAALAARGTNTTLELVGGGTQQAPLRTLATELGIADRVRFRGWLPFPEVRRAMSEATLLVHPSEGLGDGLPNVVREAMALGTPVIASEVAGIPDALRDGCGVLVPPRNVDALAHAIAQLLNDPARRHQIAARARRRTEERYDLWRNGARLAGVLQGTAPVLAAAPLEPVREPTPAC